MPNLQSIKKQFSLTLLSISLLTCSAVFAKADKEETSNAQKESTSDSSSASKDENDHGYVVVPREVVQKYFPQIKLPQLKSDSKPEAKPEP